jgi:hypothetical protein
VEKGGAATLRLVGDVVPVDKVEVVKKVKEDLLKDYPFTATQVADVVKKVLPNVPRHAVWKAIAENDLKNNPDYSSYVFPNNTRKINYKKTGDAGSAPSIYNQNAIDFLIRVLKV